MKIDKKTYQAIIILLSLLHINFFVFSPYFHHHHSEKEFVYEQSEIIYSPLINDCCEVDCDESTEHHLEHCSDNSHSVEICSAYNLFMTKNVQPKLAVDAELYFGYVITDDTKTEFLHPTQEDFFHLKWERLVHSATNISPPTT